MSTGFQLKEKSTWSCIFWQKKTFRKLLVIWGIKRGRAGWARGKVGRKRKISLYQTDNGWNCLLLFTSVKSMVIWHTLIGISPSSQHNLPNIVTDKKFCLIPSERGHGFYHYEPYQYEFNMKRTTENWTFELTEIAILTQPAFCNESSVPAIPPGATGYIPLGLLQP